ncbi:MAG: hypothetical protein SF051_06790 [Elusimicrobiota bacterium]|nr:hypothetical protein [Elusimicrobiota bacterium]
MKRLWCALLLAASPLAASADEGEAPGRAAAKARRLVENLPVEARVELRMMYRRYADAVANRLEQGWRPGLLDEAAIAGEEDGEAPFRPARLTEEMTRARRREIQELEATLRRKSPDEELREYNRVRRLIQSKNEELARLRAQAVRDKGLARDWSDLVWSEFVAMGLEHWSARDEIRRARPLHAAAVACSPAEAPSVCLAFDPWRDGRADVFAFDAWDEGALGGRFPRDYLLHDLPEKAP